MTRKNMIISDNGHIKLSIVRKDSKTNIYHKGGNGITNKEAAMGPAPLKNKVNFVILRASDGTIKPRL